MSVSCHNRTKCIAAKSKLFDHLVCNSEERRRNNNIKVLGSFKIDDELEFCRLLNWNICRVLALQNFVDELSGAAVFLSAVRST